MDKVTVPAHRAVVIAPFFDATRAVSRPQFVGSVLAELMPVDVVTSDFDHLLKATRETQQCQPFAEIAYVHTLPYRSNVSIARMLSHLLFSLRAAAYFRKNRNKYTVVYATVPLNIMAWLVFRSPNKGEGYRCRGYLARRFALFSIRKKGSNAGLRCVEIVLHGRHLQGRRRDGCLGSVHG